jgi:hypothetical protein
MFSAYSNALSSSAKRLIWKKRSGVSYRIGTCHLDTVSNGPICKNCYVRKKWQEKYVPKNAKCDRCRSTSIVSKYGIPIWVRDKKRKDVFYCKGCFVIIRDTGQIRPQEARKNIGIGIHKALDKDIIFVRTQYTLDESVFDTITEKSAYWMDNLMSDGNISSGKTGNPRIALTLAKVDYLHIVKFYKFLKCTNPIKPKKKKYRGMIAIQYYLRFTSKHIAEILIAYGIVPRKSLKAIGLENNRHFWRGVFDGDGYLKNKDGKEGDRMVLTGSNDLCAQFGEFIKKNIPGARVTIKKIRKFSKLYIYSDTARAVAKLLYQYATSLNRQIQEMMGICSSRYDGVHTQTAILLNCLLTL